MLKKIALLLAIVFLQACGTITYVPQEYVIADGRIPKFDVNGAVDFINAQPDQGTKVVFPGSMKWVADYHLVTEKLIEQLKKEVQKNTQAGTGGARKAIRVRVEEIHGQVNQQFFHATLIGRITVTVILGDGPTILKIISNNTPGNLWRALNGAIALSVIDILKDPQVRDYLAK